MTAAIYLRVAAEVALRDLADRRGLDEVPPFWRLITPGDRIAAKLSCGPEGVAHLIALDGSEPSG
ncbi:MAG: hypothetical protein ACK4L4_11585 [Gemmobacter sp.]